MAKFGAALSGLKDAKAKPSPEATATTPPPTPQSPVKADPEAPARRGRGRPPGMRSSPDYEPTTIFLRKDLKHQVNLWLMYETDRLNLSSLINRLLSEHVQQHADVIDILGVVDADMKG